MSRDDANLLDLAEKIRSRVDPGYEPTFLCRGGCGDTGWIEVDDGLRDGKRVAAPTVRRCRTCRGKPAQGAHEDRRGGEFS